MFVLSSSEFLVAEGHNLKFSVLRRGDASLEEKVCVCTSNQSAKAGLDYEPLNRELIFKKGERQKDIEIQIYTDEELEFEELFRIQLLQLPQKPFWGDGQLGNPSIAIVKILDVEFGT